MTLAALAVLAATAVVQQPSVPPRTLAAERHEEAIHRMRYRLMDERKPVTAAEIAAIRPVVDELAADLVDPSLGWNHRRPALRALQHLRQAAVPAIPTLVQVLDMYREDNGPPGVGHFCEVTQTFEAVAPRDERAIRAVTEWLQQNTKSHSICHRCGCALQALEAAGPAARAIASPVLQTLAGDRVLSSDDFQLGRTLAAVGVSAALSPTLMDRMADEGVSTYDRAEILRALAKDASQVPDPQRLLGLAAQLLGHRDRNLREAAAETLGALGPPALDPLRLAIARPRLPRARESGRLAGEARPGRRTRVRRSRRGARPVPRHRQGGHRRARRRGRRRDSGAGRARARRAGLDAPLVFAGVASVRARDPRLGLRALDAFTRGPGGHGFVRVEVKREGRGPIFFPASTAAACA